MSNIYKSEAGKTRIETAYRSWLDRWPVPAEFVTVPTSQGDTFVVVSGSEQAPPLVLLHGSIGNAATWLGDIATYAAHFRCYAVDIIGEPGLSAPSRPDLRSDAYAIWLDDVLSGLKLEKTSILALSLGGLFAFDFAARRPGRVTALAGISPAGICHSRNFILKYLPFFFLGDWGKKKVTEAIMGPMPENLPAEVHEFLAFQDLLRAEFNPRTEALPVLSDAQISKLDFPILVVTAGKDVLLKTEETRDRLRALAPNAQVDFRPNARHFIPATSDVILPFLKHANGL
ncbi:MAG: alpha/beta hydrolase [Hyphomicrobiaceae bacterium]|nr:alpha/beta hydrolase [Hyphomicrobiaceae bacterium]MCC0023223.1 alpha/beta hydrolase [Hyphomicrobiaceae bacterium]